MRTLSPETLQTITAGIGQHAGYAPRNAGASAARPVWLAGAVVDMAEDCGIGANELFPGIDGWLLTATHGEAATSAAKISATLAPAVNAGDEHPPADWWAIHGGAFGA